MYKDFQQPLVHLPVAATSRRSKRSSIDKKNVTGLFLAAEGNIEPKKPISVPPLARSRLVSRRPKTPSEKRSQQKSSTVDNSREWTPCAIEEEYWEIPALRNRCSTAPIADDDENIDYKKELKGLMDCYQKVCGATLSTLSSLQTLLPRKRSQSRPDHNKDFLSIRSFQSPSQAEIMAIFPPQVTSRPKTYPHGTLRPLSTTQGTFYSVKGIVKQP
ncbi:DgyrCDS13099 [Dimorphilus gyrociliatus]|uniref:DgyrCDS13099 n=1 Tax=Dimorphilus gyrociliatus TaxID=2664684 RepID=A0A7I8W9Q8_9ANNE|nr:DgyrCDS13099 [Dimorphilus gyrociliatus]